MSESISDSDWCVILYDVIIAVGARRGTSVIKDVECAKEAINDMKAKAERFDAMAEEYAKAKGEASRLKHCLDDVIDRLEGAIQVESTLDTTASPLAVQLNVAIVAQYATRILEIAKGGE